MSDLYEVEHPAKPRMPRPERKALIKATQKSRGEDLEREIEKDRAADARGTLVLPWWLAVIKRRNNNHAPSLGKMPQVLCIYLAELGILESKQQHAHFTPDGQIIVVISITPWQLGKSLWPAA